MYKEYIFEELKTNEGISDFGWHLANFFFNKSGNKILSSIILLLTREIEKGNTCINLLEYAGKKIKNFINISEETLFPDIEVLQKILMDSSYVSLNNENTPFIIVDNYMTTNRFFKIEKFIYQKLKNLSSKKIPDSSHFISDSLKIVDNNLSSYFSIITGGPGTGKTTIVSKIIAESQKNNLKTAVCAPTGKAVSRLTESIKKVLNNFEEGVNLEISTIHGLLKFDADGFNPQFNEKNRLKFDIIILDEASMIDIFLMEKILKATDDSTVIILTGDKYQLASVNSGAVFSDICDSYKNNKNVFVELKKNYRFSKDSALYKASNAVKNGDAKEFFDSINDEVRFIEIKGNENPKQYFEYLKDYIDSTLEIFEKKCDDNEIFNFFSTFQILSPFRKGRWSVEEINFYIENMLKKSSNIVDQTKIFKKIIVTENDYQNNIFNGDTGFLKKEEKVEYGFFKDTGDSIKKINSMLLPRFETAHGITVHKSQGSEFDSVLFFAGVEKSPILTRELLYTAITRARKNITIIGSKSTITTCIRQNTNRETMIRRLEHFNQKQ